MNTTPGGEPGKWMPVLDRGDGAWIGVTPEGEIGVGIETEARASLRGSGYVPLWVFMERDLAYFIEDLRRNWASFDGRGVSKPEDLVERTIESAWDSGRQYWVDLAVAWMLDIVKMRTFDSRFVADIGAQMLASDNVSSQLKDRLRISIQGGGGASV